VLASLRDSRFLQTMPDRDRTDGFFIARLRRR
jgi:16S rRNA C967 or C1407 C5-methylase (RsmB/RsmF family)